METVANIFIQTLLQVGTSFLHNWPYLLLSVVISVLLKLYVDSQKVSAFLLRYRRAGVIGATAAAVGTPLCSCGTTAIILGMMASMMPWAPIVAFMVASPLTSPEELIYSAGLFGWPFALVFFASSIVLGLVGGAAASILEGHGWLANQTRFSTPEPASLNLDRERAPQPSSAPRLALTPALSTCGCGSSELALEPASQVTQVAISRAFISIKPAPAAAYGCGSTPQVVETTTCGCSGTAEISSQSSTAQPASTCGCGSDPVSTAPSACGCDSTPSDTPAGKKPRVTRQKFLNELVNTGGRLLLMFTGFAFVGYFLNGLIPSEWVAAIFGSGNVYSVPLAATLGIPLYINSEGSLPLVRALIDGGMSQGAAMAFLITGSGTSVGAIAGALTIARWRVIGLVVGTLWVGAIAFGYLFDLGLAMHLF